MSVSGLLAPHLPLLRRFGRALTGSQVCGDAFAMAAVQTVLAHPLHPDLSHRPREILYASFLKVWNAGDSQYVAHCNDNVSGQLGADYSLAQMTPMSRAVFLLRSVEGFTSKALARMLDTSTAAIEVLVAQAGQEIASGLCTEVLIIEPDRIAAQALQAYITSLGHHVIATARTHREAVAIAHQQLPGLVLTDIQLADGSSGLEAVNDILCFASMPAIFITAFPERLLLIERPEPTFLITKPYRYETVRSIINHALFFSRRDALVARSAALA